MWREIEGYGRHGNRCVTNFVSVTNRNPPDFENSLTVANKCLFEPGYHLAGFVFGMSAFDIVARESHIKGFWRGTKLTGIKFLREPRSGVIIPSIAVIRILGSQTR